MRIGQHNSPGYNLNRSILFHLFLLECCSNSELTEQNIIYNPATLPMLLEYIDIEKFFEACYSAWCQDLADQENRRMFLNLSTGKGIVSKQTMLTWRDVLKVEIGQHKEYLEVVNKGNSFDTGQTIENEMDQNIYIKNFCQYIIRTEHYKQTKYWLSLAHY